MIARRRVRNRTQVVAAKMVSYYLDDGTIADTYPVSNAVLLSLSQETDDFVGKRKGGQLNYLTPPSNFFSERITKTFGLYAGTWEQYNRKWEVSGFASTLYTADTNHLAWPSIKTNAEYATMALAQTNPFRDTQSVPVLAWELLECATMFRLVFKTALQLSGDLFLSYKFGWEALISDLKKFAQVSLEIEKRLKDFQSLFFAYGGLRKRVFLDAYSSNDSTYYYGTFVHLTIPGEVTRRTTHRVWASVRWVPTMEALNDVDNLTSYNNALRQVLDLESLDPETVWQMVPFSFLVDYFANVSAYLQATGGRVLAKPSEICIMQMSTTRVTGGPIPGAAPTTLGGGSVSHERLTRRRVVHPVSDLAVPVSSFLTTGQQNVIAALLASLTGHHKAILGRIG